MRISDWSSDVCSSDLPPNRRGAWSLAGRPRRPVPPARCGTSGRSHGRRGSAGGPRRCCPASRLVGGCSSPLLAARWCSSGSGRLRVLPRGLPAAYDVAEWIASECRRRLLPQPIPERLHSVDRDESPTPRVHELALNPVAKSSALPRLTRTEGG